MDYPKVREDVDKRLDALRERQKKVEQEVGQLESEQSRLKAEYARLHAEQAKIKRELIALDQIIDGLNLATSDMPTDFEPTGFTDKIRKILSETYTPLVPTQIRDALLQMGVTGSSPKNLLISVHTVLERIGEELQTTQTPEGKTAYKAKPDSWLSMAALLRGEAKIVGSLSERKIVPLRELMAPVPPKTK